MRIIKYLFILFCFGIFIAGIYVYNTSTQQTELQEESPLTQVTQQENLEPEIKDRMDIMPEEEKQEFEQQVEQMQDNITEMQDEMKNDVQLLAQGEFMERGHHVAGKALLIDNDGEKVLRFEDFETDNGPSLHIYLASDLSDDDFVDLGKIKATKGNINYDVPEDVDIERYNKVLVWCVPFGVLFSYAELS